jgi:hypothetical protein
MKIIYRKIMIKALIFLLAAFLLFSCSKEAENNPVNGDDNSAAGFINCQVEALNWSANERKAYRQQGTLFITGLKTTPPAAELNFRIINIHQPGTYGISENEPGYQYFVKSTYTLKSADGSPDKVYTAYYEDYSLMKINSINETSIDAEFNILLFNQDRTDSVTINSGRMNLVF